MGQMRLDLLVVGCGHMGAAIVRGVLGGLGKAGDSREFTPGRVGVVDPDRARRESMAGDVGVAGFEDIGAALPLVDPDGLVLLAVKPQSLGEAARSARASGGLGGRLVASILAGVETGRLMLELGTPRVVRVMPNLPASVGRGISALCGGAGVSSADVARVRRVFERVGEALEIDEGLMDAFTAVAGSGPAYVFLLGEAMVAGAERVGFDRATALRIVRATIAGAGELMERSSGEPSRLREAVTSKGGTTAAALGVLDVERVVELWTRAIESARDRGRELGRG